MKKYLRGLPKEISSLLSIVRKISDECGYCAYLVGGLVRDLILGAPKLDVDIVVEGDGIKFAGLLSKRLGARFVCYHRFGTATIIIGTELKIDIASARKEIYLEPAALPLVSSGNIRDDLARRDFSINAMAIDITRHFGALIDFFNGRNDLENKKISVLHPLSFIDDPTRILRAVRFEQRYGFKIEAGTLKILKDAARLKMLEKVGPQRLRNELILMLSENNPAKVISRLQNLYGLKFLNAHLALDRTQLKLFGKIKRENAWFKKSCFTNRKPDFWLVYFFGLIDKLNNSDIKLILNKLKLRRQEEKRILEYKKNSRKIAASLTSKNLKPQAIVNILSQLSYEAIMMLRAKSANVFLKKYTKDFLKKYGAVRLSICGQDLKDLGIAPGPDYKMIFRRVLGAKLNGLVKTRDQELGLVKRFKK